MANLGKFRIVGGSAVMLGGGYLGESAACRH